MWYILEATVLSGLSIPVSSCFLKKLHFIILITGDQGSLDTERSQEPWCPYLKKNPFSSLSHLQPFKAARDLQLWLFSEGLPVPDEVSSSSLLSA